MEIPSVVDKNIFPELIPSGSKDTTPQCLGKRLLSARRCCQRDGAWRRYEEHRHLRPIISCSPRFESQLELQELPCEENSRKGQKSR